MLIHFKMSHHLKMVRTVIQANQPGLKFLSKSLGHAFKLEITLNR